MILSLATEGFILHLQAEGYSPSTVTLYKIVLDNLAAFLNDPDVETISFHNLQKYMVYLQTDYVPRRFGSSNKPLSGSSLQNHWKAIRTFFKWCSEELELKNRPDIRLKLPKNNPKTVLPFTEDEIKSLLKAAEYTDEVKPGNHKPFRMHRRTAARDLAVIYIMLDTGCRVGEISRLNIEDVNVETGNIIVTPFGNSGIKTKSRMVYLGKNARRSLWRYLTKRKGKAKLIDPSEPLFLSERGRRLDRNAIRCLLADLGKRAGVASCHPHRFRHTFAIEFLRGGGDVFSLQKILGHATLKMVEHYLSLANSDVEAAHRRASPSDRIVL